LRATPADGLRSHELLTENLSLAVSPKHPLAKKTSVALRELERERFILYKSEQHSTRQLTLEFCRNAGFEPKVEFESEQAETIQNLVAVNLGVIILPDMVFEHRIDV